MTFGDPGFGAPRSVAYQAWDALFWVLFVADLCLMQYLLALVFVLPFALMAGGLAALLGWLPLLFLQALYAAGLVFACILRLRRPLVTTALLVTTPFIVYGAWYFFTKAGWVPRALSPMLS